MMYIEWLGIRGVHGFELCSSLDLFFPRLLLVSMRINLLNYNEIGKESSYSFLQDWNYGRIFHVF